MKSFCAFLMIAFLSVATIFGQTSKDYIGLSVNVTPSYLSQNGFSDLIQFRGYFSSYLSSGSPYEPSLNEIFSNINVELYVDNVYLISGPDALCQGAQNTIIIKYCLEGDNSSNVDALIHLENKPNLNFNAPDHRTFVHEFSHVFGLKHCFNLGTTKELVARPYAEGTRSFFADCDFNGDGICETQSQCGDCGLDANGDSYFDVDDNYMNYYPHITTVSTDGYFTVAQYARMRFEVESNGYANGFVDYEHNNKRLKADFDFSHDNFNYSSQNNITFDNTSTHRNGTDISDPVFMWDFGDGSNIENTSSYSSKSHTYTNPGTYKVRLTCKWYDYAHGVNYSNYREKDIRINKLLSAPYIKTFESENEATDFYFNIPLKNRIYYGFNNYAATVIFNSMTFCVDATSGTNQILSFDINHIEYSASIYSFSNNEPLSLYINDQLVTSYALPYKDSWATKYVDLSPYAGQIVNIRLSSDNGVFLVDNLKLESISPLSVSITKNTNCNGQATANAQGGYPPYSYLWSDAAHQATATAINLTGGNYTVTVTDSHGGTATSLVNISGAVSGTPVITITPTNISCSGKHDGAAIAAVSGGLQPYHYHWSNNYPLPDNANLYPGTYTVTVTDDNTCVNFASVVISEPAPVSLSVTSVNTCQNQCNGTATAVTTGGTFPYTYEWLDGQTGQTAYNLCAGSNYKVIVSDFNGCQKYSYVSIGTFPQPTSILISNGASCFGYNNGSIDLTVNNGTPPYTYLWSTGQSTEDLSNIFAGSYSVTITDNNNCETQNSTVVTQPHEITISPFPVVTNPSCYGSTDGAVSISVLNGGTPPFSYLWSNGAIGPDIAGLEAATYTVTVTDSHSCTQVSGYGLTGPEPVIISVSTTDVSCTGVPDGTATINIISGGIPPYSYNWSNGQTTQTITGLESGIYSAYVSDRNYCSAELTFQVHTDPALLNMPASGINISTGIVWNNNYIIDGQVEIQNGGKLTIQNSTIRFTPNSGIIVREGGKLIVENSTLTRLAACGDMWPGITAYGNDAVSQNGDPAAPGYPQAFVNIKGSTIEYAYTGIYAGDPFLKDAIRGSGAVVWVDQVTLNGTNIKSKFNNNIRSVVFKNYGYDNISYFKNVDFLRDNQINNAASNAGSAINFIVLLGGRNITFQNITFNNQSNFYYKGAGIISLLPLYSAYIYKCNFTNLEHGINGLLKEAKIIDNKFYGNNTGIRTEHYTADFGYNEISLNQFFTTKECIYISNGNYDIIKNNTFNLPYSSTEDITGIFIISSQYFYITDNTFNGPYSATCESYGIVSENTNKAGVIFNNTFTGIDIGIQTQITSQSDNLGLKIRCNYFGSISTHGIRVQDGQLMQQGANCDPNVDNSNQAGNEWLDGYTTGEKDIYVPDDISFVYKAHERNVDMDFYTQANSSSQLWKTYYREICYSVYKTTTSCGSYIPGLPPPPPTTPNSDYLAAIYSLTASARDNISSAEQQITALKAMIDGGNTAYLIDRVNQPLAAGTLKNELLASLPLSDDVMLAAITRTNPLPAGTLKEILLPNAPLSPKVIEAVTNRNPRLPKGIVGEIMAAQQNAPLYPKLDELYSELNYWTVELGLLRSELIRLKLENGQKAEAIELLKESASTESRKQLAEIYLGDGETALSRAMLDTIMLDTAAYTENVEYSKLMGELITEKENNSTIQEMDAVAEQKVREVAESGTMAAVNAEAVLNHTGKGNYKHHIHKGNNARSLILPYNEYENNNAPDAVVPEYLNIYPNPYSGGTLQVEYKFNNEQDKILNITDVTGKILKSYTLNPEDTLFTIEKLNLPSGIYYFHVNDDNNTCFNGKIIIID